MKIVDILTTGNNGKYAPYTAMANAIIDLSRQQGDCQPEDLLQAGFIPEDIQTRWHMAHAMASIELKLMQCADSSNSK